MGNSVTRRSFLKASALGSAGLLLHRRSYGQPARLARKPNLVVFLPDQQRADTISCYGAPRAYSPNLNQLASQSCVFQRAYAAQPVCTPSRSCLLTGTWPHQNRCTRNGLPLSHETMCLPELIADSDYRFGYLGKWHLGDEIVAQHGFDEWVSIVSGRAIDLRDSHHYARPLCDYEKFLRDNGLQPDDEKDGGLFSKRLESKLPLDLSKPKFLETKACDFLERHQRGPFVLFVSFFEPHPPYNGPLNDLYLPGDLAEEPTAHKVFGADIPLRYRLRQEWTQQRYGVGDRFRQTKARYLGLVTEVDRSIGAILAKLERLGLSRDTIVMHTSDHGDMMSAHGLMGKEVMFEPSLRIPWIVRLPGQERSISVAQPVSHIDFAPTVIDLLGRAPQEQCMGKSIAPLLRGEAMPAGSVFAEWHPGRKNKEMRKTKLAKPAEVARAFNESTRTVITPDGWKMSLRDADRNELYNLNTDPGETQNLYAQMAKTDLGRSLTGQIHQWQETAQDHVRV